MRKNIQKCEKNFFEKETRIKRAINDIKNKPGDGLVFYIAESDFIECDLLLLR